MLDIGWSELLVIAVVAIIVVGPKDLPKLMRSIGFYAGKLRRTAADFRRQFEAAMAESEAEEVRKNIESIRKGLGPLDLKAPVDKPLMTPQSTPGQTVWAEPPQDAAKVAPPPDAPKPADAPKLAEAPKPAEAREPPAATEPAPAAKPKASPKPKAPPKRKTAAKTSSGTKAKSPTAKSATAKSPTAKSATRKSAKPAKKTAGTETKN